MNPIRFEPRSIANLLWRDLDWAGKGQSLLSDRYNAANDWLPAVDIIEEKDGFVVRADVPGVDAADIDVKLDGGVLSIAGERLAEDRSESDGVARFERSTGRFCRRFTLPDSANADGVTAKSAKGILEITIPKQAEIQPRRIAVEAA